MKRGIFLNVSISSKDSSKKSIYLRNFFSRQNQISVNSSIIWCFSTQPTLRAENEIDFQFRKIFTFDISSQNKIKVGLFNIFLLCRLPCNKNFCHCWSYCQWGTCWGPPPSTSCSSWLLSSCLWTGRRHLRKWVLFYLSTVASLESGEGKGGSAVAFPKHLSSHCGVKNIVIAIN